MGKRDNARLFAYLTLSHVPCKAALQGQGLHPQILLKLTTEWVIKNYPEHFEKARQSVETYFCNSIEGKRYPKDWYQLSNDIWVLQSNSAKGHINFCRRLLTAVGISELEWSIEEFNSELTGSVDN